MAEKFFLLTMMLTKQGVVKGSSTRKDGALDFSTGMECHGFDYSVTTPVSSPTSALSGRRVHTPVTIVREVDKASPLLWQALCSNEGFKTATLSFARPTSDGKLHVATTIQLTNGRIIAITSSKGASGKACENLTLMYDEMLVNGVRNAVVPHHLRG
jgi:type VI secretion system Hcp family effector